MEISAYVVVLVAVVAGCLLGAGACWLADRRRQRRERRGGRHTRR